MCPPLSAKLSSHFTRNRENKGEYWLGVAQDSNLENIQKT